MTTKSSKTKKKAAFDYKTIGSVEDACKHLNFDINSIPDLSMLPGDLGEKFKAGILCAIFLMAINNGWTPDYKNSNQVKYYPWPWVSSSGFGFSGSDCSSVYSSASVGSRLCTDSSEKALWALEKCKEHYEKWLL
jgi:hypothetical protein